MRRIMILSLSILITSICYGQKSEVPLEKKVAQMLVLGFRGTEVSDSSEIVCAVHDKGIGGVILFEHNIAQPRDGVNPVESLRVMCTKLQGAAADRLIIAIDQEGGKVNRMKTKYGFAESVTAQYLGLINNEDSSRHYYGAMAKQLKKVGINVNFAPDVDLNINPQCPVIGVYGRSYSAHAAMVNRHAGFLIDEHHKYGVRTSLKHFPGHGSSVLDSHLGFTDVTHTWKRKELKPYRYFIRKSLCDMVMVSHTFNSRLDPLYPATLSRLTIDSLLRKKLGYNGIVITDDMNMKAITTNYTLAKALTMTINAGVDMIIIGNNISGSGDSGAQYFIETIVSLVKQGAIPTSRIDEAYNRIAHFKQGLNE